MIIVDGQVWRGIHKWTEESGELSTELGKLGPYPIGPHPDGKGDLELRATMEIADVYAVLDYFTAVNGLDRQAIEERRAAKLAKFHAWKLTGIPVGQDPQR